SKPAPAAKKLADDFAAGGGEHSLSPLNLMVVVAIIQKLQLADHSTSSGFSGAKHQAANTGVNQGAYTHGAGFDGDIEGGSRKAIIANIQSGIAQAMDFRMAAGIAGSNGMIEAATYNLAIGHQHRTHRHLIGITGALRHCQRLL